MFPGLGFISLGVEGISTQLLLCQMEDDTDGACCYDDFEKAKDTDGLGFRVLGFPFWGTIGNVIPYSLF